MFRVLIVDDNRSVHSFVRILLGKAEGITTTSVMNGGDAVKLFKEGAAFELVLLDWEMPVLTGPETFEQLKTMGIKVPVVMMTTRNSPEDIKKMLDSGISEYLMKPFTLDILFQKIEASTGKSFSYV